MSNGINIAVESSSSESKTGFSQTHRSSVVTFDDGSNSVTPTHILEWLTLSREDSPVSPLVSQASNLENMTIEICGLQSFASLAQSSLNGYYWKMYQESLIQDTFGESLCWQPRISWGEDVRRVANMRVRPNLPIDGLCRSRHDVAHYVDRISATGNGQVPIVAATAWKILTGLDA